MDLLLCGIASSPLWHGVFSAGTSITIPERVLQQALARSYSAHGKLGKAAFAEACKGLSRELSTNNPSDLERFAQQLRHSDILSSDTRL